MRNDLLAAFALLTILPIRRELNVSGRALAFFPIVGVVIGVVLVGAMLLLQVVFAPIISAALVVLLWVLLTGALHLDGVSDACDALFAATTRERRLEILRDVHIGAFGAAALVLVLLLKFAALNQVTPSALFLAPLLARWAIVYAAAYPLARSEGMAALFTRGLARKEITLATLITFVCAVPFGWFGVGAWVVSLAVATLLARFAISRLGGLSGDLYGLICEAVEVAVLLFGSAHF